jgi:carboxymethylenebutenolidase
MEETSRSSSTSVDLSRRQFVVSTVAAGFALAAQPVSAQTIVTDTEGLVAGDVKIPVSGGEMPGYRAMPKSGKSFPIVLVVQEIFGVHEHIKDVCRRFAKLGHLAVAPELYARQGDVSRMAEMQEIMKVVAKVPDAQVMSDLDASVAWAVDSGKGDVSRLGITGFCWGGRVVWLYNAHNPKVKAGVAWYGRLVGQPDELHPKQPIDVAATLKVPVLGLYGGKDQGIPLDTVEKMRAELKKGQSGSEIVVYPNAGHAFHADYRPSYQRQAAEDGWRRLRDWFKKNHAA